jgi:uncharacterized protein
MFIDWIASARATVPATSLEIVLTSAAIIGCKPGTKVIRIGADGSPRIEGYRCAACQAVMAVATMACRACASRTSPEPFRAVETGRLYTWSVVHRSYPGVAVPFVSAIVDLDDGLSFKGTLKGVAAEDLRAGIPVRLIFDDAGGAVDEEGAPYVGFHFVAEGASA